MGCGSDRSHLGSRIIDRSGEGRLPVGTENFCEIVSECVYVDKTLFVADLIHDRTFSATLLCRPRDFGKSVAISMLQAFLEMPVEGFVPDKTGLFDGLAVAGDPKAMRECGAHPVIRLDLSNCAGGSYGKTLELIAREVASEYQRHCYLLDDSWMLPEVKGRFRNLMAEQDSEDAVRSSLTWLVSSLARHHGSKVVVLIDGYDVPVVDGNYRGYSEEISSFRRDWLAGVLTGSDNLFMGVLTGLLPVWEDSALSGLNNMEVYTTLDEAMVRPSASPLRRWRPWRDALGMPSSWMRWPIGTVGIARVPRASTTRSPCWLA